MSNLGTAWTLARRDLRGRFVGLRLLVICLFLGVATLAAIGSLTSAITGELGARGRTILGGDIEIGISQREATKAELASFQQAGTLSQTIRMQAMVRLPDGSDSQLAEFKGVDTAYPLYGQLTLASGATAPQLGQNELLVTPALLERLSLKKGDTVSVGEQIFTITGVIGTEPDRLSEGLSLGPVVIASLDGLRAARLIQPGSLYEAKYRIKLPDGANPEQQLDAWQEQYRLAGWETKTRDNGAPSTARFIERMGQFLTLVGLAALVIAGIGVGNGVASYLRGKQSAIATLKVLGADSALIFRVYLLQILSAAGAAIAAGLLVGALAPSLILKVAGDVLPVSPDFALYPVPLLISAAYGLLIAVMFALPPLARTRYVTAAGLFRAKVESGGRVDRATAAIMVLAIGAVLALAIGNAKEPLFSAGFLAALLGVFLILSALGWLVRRTALRLPRPKSPLLRLAITNLHRPGAQTGQLVVALGLGLTLFVTLAAIQTSMTGEIRNTVPKEAPNFFILDIPVAQKPQFEKTVQDLTPAAEINIVPTLRGSIIAYGNQRVADLKQIPEGAWMLRGDRGLTYSAAVPEGSKVVAGKWWPENYAGPPLVSIDQEMAEILGLTIGDTLTVSLLGVEIKAKIASFREVNWRNFGFNYIMVFPPSTLIATPHNVAATIQLDPAQERPVAQALTRQFPSISLVRVKEISEQIGTILNQMATAIGTAASIAVLSGIAVLVGAIAASRQSRMYDSVILKLLGATRRQILGAQGLEYLILSVVLAVVALALGSGAAWYVITQIFEFGWQPDWPVVLMTLAVGGMGTLAIGLIGSLPLLAARPAAALRDL